MQSLKEEYFVPKFLREDATNIGATSKNILQPFFAIPYFIGVCVSKICKLAARKFSSLCQTTPPPSPLAILKPNNDLINKEPTGITYINLDDFLKPLD